MSLLLRKQSDEDLRRSMQLRRIFGPDRQGVVEGVEFDLRHPMIDPDEWYTYFLGDKAYQSQSPLGPLLWFPWMGAFDEIAFRKQFFPDDDITLPAEESEWIEEQIRAHTPEQFVHVGDKLVIADVECVNSGDTLDHLHDSEIRCAYLSILRADGTIVEVNEPLQFIGYSTVTSFHGVMGFFRGVAWRVLRHFGLKSFPETLAATKDAGEGYAGAALFSAFELYKNIERELHLDFYEDGTRAECKDAHEKVRLVNDAVALGYMWAKAEDEMRMQPLAEVSLRLKANAERGGRKSGEARRDKRANTWEPHARELAMEIRAANPAYSQERIATEIVGGWVSREFDAPSHQTLKALVSNMERDGEIAPRKRR